MSRITPPVHKISHAVRAAVRSNHPAAAAAADTYAAGPAQLGPLDRARRQWQAPASGSASGSVSVSGQVHGATQADRHDSRQYHAGSARRPVAHAPRPVPLMQGFRTSVPAAAAAVNDGASNIDFILLPRLTADNEADAGEAGRLPFASATRLRVPLLPDNYQPDRSTASAHAPESPVAPVPRQEIHVVSSNVVNAAAVVAALSEVVGNEGLDVPVSQWTHGFSHHPSVEARTEGESEPGVLREFWTGLVDDFFGARQGPKLAI